MPSVVLLGDSVLDNTAYVRPGEPDVTAQLGDRLPNGWHAVKRATDGAVISDVPSQLQRLPDDAELLVLSVGGNDALGNFDVLEGRASTVAESLLVVAEIAGAFERRYAETLRGVIGTNVPSAVCTIYYPRFGDPLLQAAAVAALPHFNDVILRLAIANAGTVIDLRAVCDDEADYANAIEPSARGGAKIADAIADLVHDLANGRWHPRIYIGRESPGTLRS